MRDAIWDLLNDAVPEMQGRWFQPNAVTAATPKPFGVIRVGVQDAGEHWAPGSTVVEVWPFIGQAPLGTLDAIVKKIVDALDETRFAEAGVQYLSEHDGGAAQDTFDPDWKALTRPVRFRVYTLGWLSSLTYDPDPVAVLQTWTEATIAETQQNPETWNPQDPTPGVYWRLAEAEVAQQRPTHAWIDAQLRAHVIAPSPDVRSTYVRRVVEQLGLQRHLVLPNDSPLLFQVPISAVLTADPFKTGQVLLRARFGVVPVAPVVPPIERVVVRLKVAVAG